jgi:hypothetical protein
MESTLAKKAVEGFGTWSWPDRSTVNETLRAARGTLVDVRNATEDFAAETALKVRKRPLAALGVAACGGTLAGAAFGFALGRFAPRRA